MLRSTKIRSAELSLLLHVLLPDEIIEDILLRLPVKSLVKFKCVSKSWLSLIESDGFTKIHLQKSTGDASLAHHRVIFNHRNRHVMSDCSLHSLLNSNSSAINDPTNNLPKTGNLVGCCNGLLCFFNQADGSFFLCNPATRIFIELPKIGLGFVYQKLGFGWDESTHAYKVFVVLSDRGKVYSSKTKTWKTVEHGRLSLYGAERSGQLVGGKIHWATYYKHGIEFFDLETEEFGRIELPFTPNGRQSQGHQFNLWLGEIKGSLCVMRDHLAKPQLRVDVWVTKEESWIKLVTFSLAFFERIIYALTPLLGEGPDGEIFLIYGDAFLVYSPKLDKVVSAAKNITSFSEARIYVENLVSPLRILGHYGTSPACQLNCAYLTMESIPRWLIDLGFARIANNDSKATTQGFTWFDQCDLRPREGKSMAFIIL